MSNKNPPPTIPQNIDMEMALLGGIMANNTGYEKVSEFLRPEHFMQKANGDIFDACSKLIEAGQLADRYTLDDYISRDAALTELTGPAYLDKLLSRAVPLVEVGAYAKILYDMYLRREIISLGQKMANQAFSSEDGIGQIEAVEQTLYDLATTGNFEGDFLSFKESIQHVLLMTETARKRDGALTVVTTGLSDLDMMLGGLHPSELVILAGSHSMGKTTLATTIAYEAAVAYHRTGGEEGAVVGYFSLELSAERLATRIISRHTHIYQENISRGSVTNKEFDHLFSKSQSMHDLPIFIDDTPDLTVGAIRNRVRRLKRQQSLNLVIIDHFQLISGNLNSHNDGRSQAYSGSIKALKQLARELDVPVLLLVRLPPTASAPQCKRPTLGDLSFIDDIENVADTVLLMFSEEKYLGENVPTPVPGESEKDYIFRRNWWSESIDKTSGLVEVNIAKNRSGPEGTIELEWHAFGFEDLKPLWSPKMDTKHVTNENMKFSISHEEYFRAITETLECTETQSKRHSAGGEALQQLLANIWCPEDTANIWSSDSVAKLCDAIRALDSAKQEIALKLIAGRGRYGRPLDHPDCDDVEKVYSRALTNPHD